MREQWLDSSDLSGGVGHKGYATISADSSENYRKIMAQNKMADPGVSVEFRYL